MSGFSIARQKMVDGQVRTTDVTDRRILDGMLTVPREAFVPATRQALAYLDLDLDVSEGAAKRFLIKPALTGKLLQAAEIGEGDNVLVVGCATGYLAALVARLAHQVTATECDSALAAKARDAFASLGLANVACKAAACTEGYPAAGPYDVIVLNGAAEVTPEGLLGQLREGGRLVGVSAESNPPRAMIVTRTHGEFGHRALFDAAAPVLPGLEQAAAFVF
ncbi:protein-L-isoaspartate O-methyltransferase [Bradyrhizobium sp. 186]|uniref:protein-L-isoaspartate O-methyltransferase family protein n=1 Tax=Bradyrhizobium sp. 186 TaxID=2782654 RepID=UPI002000E765|nr:protein-L-isoaspartate O-methyltransferase [Bradyrhizobium sp. 186]UPK31565.1 protein-L-isoaspartate O-methyltransferase [Bradyrhizobium sp. 186]